MARKCGNLGSRPGFHINLLSFEQMFNFSGLQVLSKTRGSDVIYINVLSGSNVLTQ